MPDNGVSIWQLCRDTLFSKAIIARRPALRRRMTFSAANALGTAPGNMAAGTTPKVAIERALACSVRPPKRWRPQRTESSGSEVLAVEKLSRHCLFSYFLPVLDFVGAQASPIRGHRARHPIKEKNEFQKNYCHPHALRFMPGPQRSSQRAGGRADALQRGDARQRRAVSARAGGRTMGNDA